MKLFLGIIVFGSIWGFLECIVGPALGDLGFSSGSIMTSVFAIGLMMASRLLYKQRGMQLGMGLVAGALRLFNPLGGCVVCSAIAIAAEGLIFEMIFYRVTMDFKFLKTNMLKASMGIISAYLVYVGGYVVTQVLTPLVSSSGFYIENLVSFMPQILSRGLLAAIIGGFTVPVVFLLKTVDVSSVKDKFYYPTMASVSFLCWVVVIVNFNLLS